MTRLNHYNVLLVEDEMLLMQSLSRHIESLEAGFKVVCQASNGEDALKCLKKENIHLVMTDIRMPVMDGLTLAKRIHEQYPHILTVILTGYADFDYAREALKQGVFDYMLKPVTMEDLENTLGRVRLHLQKFYELEEDPVLVGKDAEEIVEYTVLYMREHYMDDIDISSFSASLGFTSAYLTKLFNRYKGDTPLKYLTDIRIHEAKRLLTDTGLPIREVGERVGYPDQFHFSKTFRKLTGLNPTAYRKQEQKP
ncbi:response regulator transcription factor [Faecalicatena orotica]|uniref:Stage 0 sporulation protein A homolog n=1 Tax=Faecalicatena orotica TaxID=1544 RepID=A0A2Y9BDE4_9FIRM|nr:response regulator [Faecalicatena orotica]PWJ29941.1 helix-turn-helix protein [Faecalicatena orotica]SSA55667.1 Helix-turn-helix domain-containing protein [Faecalicatena orotica]